MSKQNFNSRVQKVNDVEHSTAMMKVISTQT